MRRIWIPLVLLTIITVISTCVALYVVLNNTCKVAKIEGTVIPLKISGNSTMIKARECHVDLKNITADTIFEISKTCNGTIIVNRTIFLEGQFKTYNISKAFIRLRIKVIIYRSQENNIVPGPPIPSCTLYYSYPQYFNIYSNNIQIVLNKCVLFPGTYNVKIVVSGITRSVEKPTHFSVEILVRTYRELVHVE
ncbi:MAG: hypothetical protein GXO23_00045 [Crenarchaeota archaeon]|nr:hypothetical protein [Thermoproteota archaeon]